MVCSHNSDSHHFDKLELDGVIDRYHAGTARVPAWENFTTLEPANMAWSNTTDLHHIRTGCRCTPSKINLSQYSCMSTDERQSV